MNSLGQSKYITKSKVIITISSIILILDLFQPLAVHADNLTSPNYNVQMSTLNITGGNKSSGSYKLGDTVGQTFQGQFDSAGYTIKAGFQYINSLIAFRFLISTTNINFGSLTPGSPSTQNHTLTVSNGSAYGYTVKAIASDQLTLAPSGPTTIPATSCDLATPCTISDANVWSSSSRYGFGYNMSGTDVDTADFVNNTYYRPFGTLANNDTPATIMQRASVTTSSTATITYKINISSTQAAGEYQNGIVFIATPSI